jgi:AP-4 complex subunit epsilon-1
MRQLRYLAASLCLSPDHEFRFMLINQFQRDMNSINYLVRDSALSSGLSWGR